MPKRPDPYLIDDENPELMPEQIRAMRPASEVLPPELYESLIAEYGSRLTAIEDTTMNEPGLDGRHRDVDGRIQQKRSDTLNKNLSHPIPGFSPNTSLGEMRKSTGQNSESKVRSVAEKKGR